MTEQELRESLISVAPSAIYANESEIVAIVEIAKAYADAQVEESVRLALHCERENLNRVIAEKDEEIERLKHAVKLWESLRDDAIDANSRLHVHNQRILDYVKSIRSKIQHGTATLYEIATIVESAIINQ